MINKNILKREGFSDLEEQLSRPSITQENKDFALKTYMRPILNVINNQNKFKNTFDEVEGFNKDRKEIENIMNKYLPDNIKINDNTISIPGKQLKETEKAIQWETENYLFWFPKSWIQSKSKTELKVPEEKFWDKL